MSHSREGPQPTKVVLITGAALGDGQGMCRATFGVRLAALAARGTRMSRTAEWCASSWTSIMRSPVAESAINAVGGQGWQARRRDQLRRIPAVRGS